MSMIENTGGVTPVRHPSGGEPTRSLGEGVRAGQHPHTPQIPDRQSVVDSLTNHVGGFTRRGKSEKAQNIVRELTHIGMTPAQLGRLKTMLDQDPTGRIKDLLHHKSGDCGGSAAERLKNRALLLFALVEEGRTSGEALGRAEGLKNAYLTLQPTERNTRLKFGGYEDLYDSLNIPDRSEKFAPVRITQDAPLEVMGKGSINEVYSVTIEDKEYVFKPMTKESDKNAGWDLIMRGIDLDDSQTARRNLAFSALGDKLDFNLPVKTEMAVVEHGGKRQIGILMERAKGSPAIEVNPDVFDRPAIRQQYIQAQLFNFLTGNVDCHSKNAMIDPDANQLKLIDPDSSFPDIRNVKDLRSIPTGVGNDKARTHMRDLPPPDLVDQVTINAFLNLKDSDIEECLEGLSRAQIDACKERLEIIKDHLGKKDFGVAYDAPLFEAETTMDNCLGKFHREWARHEQAKLQPKQDT